MIRGLVRLFRALVYCGHQAVYRERRPVGGLQVMHWVCPSCSAAWPVVKRTHAEHRRALKVGTVRAPKVVRTPATVEQMRRVK